MDEAILRVRAINEACGGHARNACTPAEDNTLTKPKEASSRGRGGGASATAGARAK